MKFVRICLPLQVTSIPHFRDTTCFNLIVFTPLTIAAFMTRNRATAVETKVISLKLKIKIKVTSKKLSFYLTVNTNNVY